MRSGFWLKACPRCGGDMYDDVDIYGTYIACLQCGHNISNELVARGDQAGQAYPAINMARRSRPRFKYSR